MPIAGDIFKKEIALLAQKTLEQLSRNGNMDAQFKVEDIYNLLKSPPNFTMGQAALPCFPFAKVLKMAPQAIASKLCEEISKAHSELVDRIEIVNGYLNFYCNFAVYGALLVKDITKGEYFSRELLEKSELEKIVIEYSQPNTHKAIHVGHLRTLFLGEAVASLLEKVGHKVVRVTYPGDMGTHVAKVLWYIKNKLGGKLPTEKQAQWLGEIYPQAQIEFETENNTDAEQKKKELSEIFSAVKSCQGEYFELWKTTREWSLNELREIYDWTNVKFDMWYTESECEKPSEEFVKQKFSEGFFVKDQGAVGIDLSQWKLGFAIFLKSDGHGLYLTKDLELLKQKFSDPLVTRSIYVVDARQKHHFQQLFKTAEIMGYPQASRSVHLSYETVNTPDGKAFASRSGSVVKLEEVRAIMEQKVKTEYLERYRGTWSDKEIDETASNITLAALKFGLLKIDNNTQVTFILDEWLRLDGDTGPYLQYVHARCNNILEKQGRPEYLSQLVLESDLERELLFMLGKYNDVSVQAAQQYKPASLCTYLLDLAHTYNRFYENCSIKNSVGEIRDSRLCLVDATRHVIKNGLAALGIVAPDRM